MTQCAIGPRFTTFLVSAAAAILLAGGCGGGGGAMPTTAPDDQKIRGLIPAVRDAAENATQFKTVFADGAAPGEAERQRYRKYAYEIKPPVKFSGDEATITVAVRDIAGKGQEIVGETEWTAVRSGSEWKLKTAPLPAGAK
jgi:hypothetical protein